MKRIAALIFVLALPLIAHATVTSTTFSVTYTCTGSVGPFAFTFPISDPIALTVTQNGVLLSSTAYTIVPVNNNYENGGAVTLNSACPSSQPLVLTRVTPLTQQTIFADNMPVPFTSFMYGLDKLTEIDQEQGSELGILSADVLNACTAGNVMVSLVPLVCVAQSSGGGTGCGSGNCVVTNPAGGAVQHISGPLTSPRVNGIYAVDGVTYTTIQSAINAAEAATTGIVLIPPGAYNESLTINTSQITLQGSGRQATTINVAGGSCGITLAAGASGAGINYDELRDFSLVGPGSSGTTDGICFTGGVNVPNDRHTFEHVAVNNFRYAQNIVGRAIWDRFIDDYFEVNQIGVYSVSAANINDDVWEGGRIGNNTGDGVYFVNTNANVAINISFDKENIEYNNTAGAVSNCAGMYLNGIAVGSVKNSYFEGNCTASTGASNGADIRLDGTYVEAFDIQDNNFWSATAYGILDTAQVTTGDWHGNRIINQGTAPILVEGSSIYSNVTVGNNFYSGGDPISQADANANFHMSGVGPFVGAIGGAGISGNTINPIIGGLLLPLVYDTIVIYNGPFTITNIGNALAGRRVRLVTDGAPSNTLSTAGTGTNALILKGGVSTETCATNQYADFEYNPNLAGSGAWVEVSSCTGSASAGVTSINSNTGALTLNGPGVTQSGNTFTFSANGSPNGIITTTNYGILQTGLYARANCVVACNVTLPSSLATGFNSVVEYGVSAGGAPTIVPNGVPYDGVTTQLLPGETTYIWTDGTSYHSSPWLTSLPWFKALVTATSPATIPNQMAVSGGTNKTVVFQDFSEPLTIPAANNNAGTVGSGWSIPSSGGATPAIRASSTNVVSGVLQFAASTSAQFQLNIPGDYDPNGVVYAKLYLTQGANTTASQTIIMQMATACGATDDPAFNSSQPFTTVTTSSTAHTAYYPTLTGVRMAGCAAGQNMNIQVSRSGSDTATTKPDVYWLSLSFPRAIVNQAN